MAKRHDAAHMSVVYSTYHSIDVISPAQHEHGLADFDLIVCDEAHRTTGATFGDDDESNFVKVHDSAVIRSTKRLYMTATPRIYGDRHPKLITRPLLADGGPIVASAYKPKRTVRPTTVRKGSCSSYFIFLSAARIAAAVLNFALDEGSSVRTQSHPPLNWSLSRSRYTSFFVPGITGGS